MLNRTAAALIGLYPPAWKLRYGSEVKDLVSTTPVGIGDLVDLLRAAAEEWEVVLTRGPWRPLKVLLLSWAVAGVVWWSLGLGINALLMLRPVHGTVNPGYVNPLAFFSFKMVLGWFVLVTPLFLLGVVVNLPTFVALRLARSRLPFKAARWLGAAGMACWLAWASYQAEWYDVWRHGVPSLRYLVQYLPLGVAFALSGAVLGAAAVREPRQVPEEA